jgi:hypothetical protein
MKLIKDMKRGWQMLLLGSMGLVLTLNFDFWTTLSFPLSAGFDKKGIIATLMLGIPFAIPHLAGNTLIFALVLPYVYSQMRKILIKIIPALAIVSMLNIISFPVSAQTPTEEVNSEAWEIVYYEDLGDIVRNIPGYYQYDLGVYGQPLILYYEGTVPSITLYGIPLNYSANGFFDYNLLSPGYMQKGTQYLSGAGEGFIDAQGLMAWIPQKFDTSSVPYSRVNYRDGYYGLGVADFVLAEKLGKDTNFQIGGRISEFNGRLYNSEVNTDQLRGALYQPLPKGWNLTIDYINNHHKAGMTFGSDNRRLSREDWFIVANKVDSCKETRIVLHYNFMEDKYSSNIRPYEEKYDLKIDRGFRYRGFTVKPSVYINWHCLNSRQGAGDLEKQASFSETLIIQRNLTKLLAMETGISCLTGKRTTHSETATLSYGVNPRSRLYLMVTRSENPIRTMYRSDAMPFGYYLPGSVSWQLGDALASSPGLKPEIITSAKLGYEKFRWRSFMSFKSTLFLKKLQRPFDSMGMGSASYSWINGEDQSLYGAEMTLSVGRWRGFELKLDYTFIQSDSDRIFLPPSYGNVLFDYQNRAFNGDLTYTFEVFGRYFGERRGWIDSQYYTLGDDNVWGARFIFKVGDFTLFWGNENIFAREYSIIPGYRMSSREEVWGVNWVFWD